MRCEDVRAQLPDVAAGATRADVEAHLASCPNCSAELGRYQALMVQMSALREELVDPPEGALRRALVRVPAWRWRLLSRRVLDDERARYAALSLGGVVVGAIAVGLVRRRIARRAMAGMAAPQTTVGAA